MSKLSNSTRYGWSGFYDAVLGPERKPKEMVFELIKEKGPITVVQLKEAIEQSGYPRCKFGPRFNYLYHLLKRSHRAGVLGWREDGCVFLWEKRKRPSGHRENLMGALVKPKGL